MLRKLIITTTIKIIIIWCKIKMCMFLYRLTCMPQSYIKKNKLTMPVGQHLTYWQIWEWIGLPHPEHLSPALISLSGGLVSILLISGSYLSCRTRAVSPRYPVILLSTRTWLLGRAVGERGSDGPLLSFLMTGLWRETVGLPIKLRHN